MSKKIFYAIFSVALTILLACSALSMGVLYDYFTSVQKGQMKTEMLLAAEGVEQSGKEYLEALKTEDCRLTLVAADGTVLYDTKSDAEAMENHGDREEIREAFKKGESESTRYSATLMEQTLYYAKRLSDGSVLRVSVSRATALRVVLGMLQPVFIILFLAMVLSAVIGNKISKKIVEPLNALNLDTPMENNTYDELAPLLSHIEKQQRQIKKQEDELLRKQNEFYGVVKNMKEGLVLLNNKRKILSLNEAAEEFFNVTEDCVGSDFISVERKIEIHTLLDTAEIKGKGELKVGRAGREFQLNVSRIDTDEDFGMVMLIFDITEKVFAERNRKEFTANFSHELKTPLHSIMGNAELIENGLAKEEDISRFAGRIRLEATRLVSLIEDIIRLSQFDETPEIPLEELDLYEAAREEAEFFKDVAEKQHVQIQLLGGPAYIKGNKQMLHEVIYNLCDNAIKYNHEGGEVQISVHADGEKRILSVSDTGIGIPPEHQARVFERFYRVDKSHSKETGGTGLGLSIVKHAAQFMGGRLELKSKEGEGTTITITFEENGL